MKKWQMGISEISEIIFRVLSIASPEAKIENSDLKMSENSFLYS